MSFIYNHEKLTYKYSLAKKEVNKNRVRKENSKGIIVNVEISCVDLILNC